MPVPVFKCQDWLDIGLAQNSTSNFAFSPIETKTFFGAWYLKTWGAPVTTNLTGSDWTVLSSLLMEFVALQTNSPIRNND